MSDAPTGGPNEVPEPSIRSARETAVERLAEHATGGRLTLDEYAERAVALEQAATVDELNAAVLGLPEETSGTGPGRRARWLVGVFGGAEQRGRWRLSSHLRIVALFGGVTLDLGAAEVESPESLITVIAVLGGVEVIAPAGVSIQLSGFSLLGGKSDERAGGPPLPASPLVHVRSVTILGGVKVKDRPPRRNLLDLVRARSGKPTAP
jgi:hypothetical protein